MFSNADVQLLFAAWDSTGVGVVTRAQLASAMDSLGLPRLEEGALVQDDLSDVNEEAFCLAVTEALAKQRATGWVGQH